MRKLLALLAIVALSFLASCGTKTTEAPATDATTVEGTATDTATDTTTTEAPATDTTTTTTTEAPATVGEAAAGAVAQ